MNWSNLPPEILTLVFRELYFFSIDDEEDREFGILVSNVHYINRNQNISQCALVCRGWRLTAQKIHLSNLVLRNQASIENIDDKSSLSTRIFVKKINYNNISGRIENEDHHRHNLMKFSELFPYLEVLQFRENSSTFLAIHNLLTSGYLPNLSAIQTTGLYIHSKTINPATIQYNIDLYVSSILIMKNRVRTIMLQLEISCYKPFFNEDLTFNIDLFPKLRRLDISSDDCAHNNIANFIESIIPDAKIKTLRVSLEFRRSLSFEIKKTPLDNISKVSIKPSYDLKRLTFDTSHPTYILDDNSLLFIMKKYPNLDVLRYHNVNDVRPFKLKNHTMSSKCCVQFLLYIFKMSHYLITNFITNEITGEVLSQVYENLKKNSDSRCKNVLELSYIRKSGQSIKDGNQVYLDIKKRTNMHHIERKVHAYFKLTVEEEYQHCCDVFEKAGKYLHEVFVETGDMKFWWILSDTILKHCVRLEHLHLDDTSTALLFYFPKVNNIHSSIIHPNLKQLSLKYVDAIQCEEVFPRISAGFPCLEVLVLKCNLGNLISSRGRYCTMVMPELSLKNVGLKMGRCSVRDRIFFKLDTIKNNSVIASFHFLLVISPGSCDLRDKGYKLKSITSKEYEKSRRDTECFTLLIQCKQLDEITIEFSDGGKKHVKCLAELSRQRHNTRNTFTAFYR